MFHERKIPVQLIPCDGNCVSTQIRFEISADPNASVDPVDPVAVGCWGHLEDSKHWKWASFPPVQSGLALFFLVKSQFCQSFRNVFFPRFSGRNVRNVCFCVKGHSTRVFQCYAGGDDGREQWRWERCFTVSPDMEVQSLEIHKICANFTKLSKQSPDFSIFCVIFYKNRWLKKESFAQNERKPLLMLLPVESWDLWKWCIEICRLISKV